MSFFSDRLSASSIATQSDMGSLQDGIADHAVLRRAQAAAESCIWRVADCLEGPQ
jgi:hypothetical protein